MFRIFAQWSWKHIRSWCCAPLCASNWADYQKLQNQFESQFVNSNSSVAGIASSLATYYLLYDNVNLINEQIDIYRSITREEIQSVAQKYLSPNQRVEIEYLPGDEVGEE